MIDGGNGLYKIGITISAPEKRLKDIQSMCPVKIKLIHYFESDDLRRVERLLHHTLRKFKSHGEWFGLNKKQVSTFKEFDHCCLDDSYMGCNELKSLFRRR